MVWGVDGLGDVGLLLYDAPADITIEQVVAHGDGDEEHHLPESTTVAETIEHDCSLSYL